MRRLIPTDKESILRRDKNATLGVARLNRLMLQSPLGTNFFQKRVSRFAQEVERDSKEFASSIEEAAGKSKAKSAAAASGGGQLDQGVSESEGGNS
jgi:hypothetical protein